MKKYIIIILLCWSGAYDIMAQDYSYNQCVRRANIAMQNNDYQSAIVFYKGAITKAKIRYGEKPTAKMSVPMCEIACCYHYIGNYNLAISYLSQALEIDKLIYGERSEECALILEAMGQFSFDVDPNISIEYFTQSLDIRRVIFGAQSSEYATTLVLLGSTYYVLFNYDKAREAYLEALAIYEVDATNFYYDNVNTLVHLARTYVNLNDRNSAIDTCKKAIAICEKNSIKPQQYVNILESIADILYVCEAYYEAIKVLDKSIWVGIEFRGMLGYGMDAIYSQLALCYMALSDYRNAIIYNNMVLHTFDDQGDPYSKATILYRSAVLYHAIGNLEEAYDALVEANEICNDIAYSTGINMSILQEIVKNKAYKGEYVSAIHLQEQVLTTISATVGMDSEAYALGLGMMSYCYSKLGDFELALEYDLESLAILNRIGIEGNLKLSLLRNILYDYYCIKDYEKLECFYSDYISSVRTFLQKHIVAIGQNSRHILCRDYIWILNVLNNSYLPNSNTRSHGKGSANSYNSILLSKGIELSLDISFSKVIVESCDITLLEKLEKLRATSAILNTYYNKPIAERPQGKVEHLETLAEQLEQDLIIGSKEYADFTRHMSIEWQDIRNSLDKDDVAIEIISADEVIDNTIESYLAALILRKGWDTPKFVELCKLDELTDYYIKGDKAYNAENSINLYNLIWSKLEPYINEGDNVYFAPDGLLYQINIEVLQDANGRRANEKWNLYRVSSTRELCMEKPTVDINSAVLYGGLKYTMDDDELLAASRTYSREDMQSATRGFVADSTMRKGWNYLPETKTEVEAIAQMCESHNVRAEIFSETSGNEESFKALSGKKTPIIHLATHGFFYKNEEVTKVPFFNVFNFDQMPQKPDNSLKRSGLILAGGQKTWLGETIPDSVEDGILLAEEIAAMDLTGTDLVVLSACETGLGEITSEGVFGLQRAFKKAGVQTLIMSLWSVNDLVASLFMRVFYQEWLSGKTKHEAFAIAQNTVRESYEGNDWAAFIMLD